MWAIISAIFKGLGDSVASWLEKRRTEKMAVRLNEIEAELLEREKVEKLRKEAKKIREQLQKDLADPDFDPLNEL